MNPAIWGSLSALSLGSADFAGRFTSRAIGPASALLGVQIVGAVVLTLWVLGAEVPLVWQREGLWLVVANGVATMVMTLLLYTGLARGPVSVVAPIVASHPVLVVAFWFVMGARPGALQWAAMAVAVVGVVLVARAAEGARGALPEDRRFRQLTILIATAAAVVHAAMVVAGQAAVPIYGEIETLWLSRLISLASITALFAVRGRAPSLPVRWWPLLLGQGLLDGFGYLFLFAGSSGEGAEIAAVTASCFGAVTTILARVVLKESMGPVQWFGIVLVFGGVGALTGAG